jgi:hypothetical protein
MNLMSSTLLLEDTQGPFDQLQAEQIALFHEAWTNAGHSREPRVSVSRSVIPITSDLDRRLFGGDANEECLGTPLVVDPRRHAEAEHHHSSACERIVGRREQAEVPIEEPSLESRLPFGAVARPPAQIFVVPDLNFSDVGISCASTRATRA